MQGGGTDAAGFHTLSSHRGLLSGVCVVRLVLVSASAACHASLDMDPCGVRLRLPALLGAVVLHIGYSNARGGGDGRHDACGNGAGKTAELRL